MNSKNRCVVLSLLAGASCLLAMPGPARADLVLVNGTPSASFVDLSGAGFGSLPAALTLQTSGIESGAVAPDGSGGVVLSGDAISGSDKANAPSLSSLGWSSTGSNVAIGFNADQEGNTGITLDMLTLTIYSGTTALGSFSTSGPITFSASDLALQPGHGNATFEFVLTAAEQATFLALVGSSDLSTLYAGLSATLGCTTSSPSGCLVSNDGPDTFRLVPSVVPLPPAAMLFGTAMVGLGLLGRRKKNKPAAHAA